MTTTVLCVNIVSSCSYTLSADLTHIDNTFLNIKYDSSYELSYKFKRNTAHSYHANR